MVFAFKDTWKFTLSDTNYITSNQKHSVEEVSLWKVLQKTQNYKDVRHYFKNTVRGKV